MCIKSISQSVADRCCDGVVAFGMGLTPPPPSPVDNQHLPNGKVSTPSVQERRWMNEQAPFNQPYQPTKLEHLANICTHGLCLPISILAAYELFQRSRNEDQYMVARVYGSALSLLFAVSTTFHCIFFCKSDCNMRHVLHRCDRAMIYVFIAGSYFPWLTIDSSNSTLIKELRWIIWVLAFLGITYQQIFHEKYKKLETVFYLITGIGPSILMAIYDNTLFNKVAEIKMGGLMYSIGIFFFKADGRVPFAHAIWHVFVAIGVYYHYVAILNNLYPIPGDPMSSILLGKEEL